MEREVINIEAEVYEFTIEVIGLENRIWRKVQLTDTSYISKLAYTVLATFQTAMYHLYNIEYKSKIYDCMVGAEYARDDIKLHDAKQTRLYELNLKLNDELTMTYDYGVDWEFKISLTGIKKLKDEKKHPIDYPIILDGAGFGIVEDSHHSEVLELIKEIDETNKVTEYALTPDGNFKKWDYRKYDLKKDNKTLKERLYYASVAYEELSD